MFLVAVLLCFASVVVKPIWRSLDPELRAMDAWADNWGKESVDPWGNEWTRVCPKMDREPSAQAASSLARREEGAYRA